MPLKTGREAPDFELDSHLGHQVRLSSFRGVKNVVVAFHPLAWTPVCSTQMQNYESEKKWFDNHEAHILSLSVDAVPAKLEWAKSLGGISYDLLSDFHPKGMIAEKYGVMRDDGITDRAIFVVNKKGIIVFAKVYDIPALPDNEEVRQLLGTL
jgi:peroxiredoxin